jgi:hypothetical protein
MNQVINEKNFMTVNTTKKGLQSVRFKHAEYKF